MRVIVCGGRDYGDRARLYDVLDAYNPSEIAQGGATGADMLALEWAINRRVASQTYSADWKAHGRAAGPMRNQRMLDAFKPDAVLAFPGGRGTADMVRRAKAAGVHVAEVPA